MALKHLGGSKMQNIERTHGVSRSTVVNSIGQTFDAIIDKFPIPPFPFHDVQELQTIADGFKSKSSGGVFENVVGAVDGFLLQIGKRAIGKGSVVQDPSKYYCRKGYYAVNCQVCCDSNRKVRAVSMLSPGAVPDRLAHLKSSLHRAIETGKLPAPFHLIGDNAYPDYVLTPFTRPQLRNDVYGFMDSYNFYLSQLRINIECTFGMLVNKFPILQMALATTRLDTVCKTFLVCCILHNLCIDYRLENADEHPRPFPAGQRYTQRPSGDARDLLREDDDFEYVDTVDEMQAEEIVHAGVNTGPNPTLDIDDDVSLRDKQMYRIARLGYVRPQAST